MKDETDMNTAKLLEKLESVSIRGGAKLISLLLG
jgi:hypothetical protein